jgi:uncharacterized protein
MDNDFVISVSLDGPEKEHNRLRVYSNGKDTFKDVMKNVGRLMESGYKKIVTIQPPIRTSIFPPILHES